jgi:hypothetical protein
MTPASLLRALERSARRFGGNAARRKLELLGQAERLRLPSARAVTRLHEAFCWLRAYPDDVQVLARVRSLLEGFASRADLRRHRDALADTGIAGTAIHYRFFAAQAQWLARHWPQQLTLDRSDDGDDAQARIAASLPAVLTLAERHALAEMKLPGFAVLDQLRGHGCTDAVFLLARIAAMPGDGFTREAFSDAIDAGYVLAPAAGTPSRTTAHFACAPVVFRSAPPPRQRPDLRAELARAPRSMRRLPPRDAQALVDLARGAMATRARSLEAFSYADARDAWLVDDGDGLAFGLVGVIPERRHVLASYYGGLLLRNGVPIGYVQADHLGARAALSFNTFETFRGGEAAFVFARWLATLRHGFGAHSFSIEPYQLGEDNDEALDSGAWWFYAKLGFAPRNAATRRLAREEWARSQHRAGHRTPRVRLQALARQHLFFDLDAARPVPWVPLARWGIRCGQWLSEQAGPDREHALDEAQATLLRACGVRACRGWSDDEQHAWRRFAPLAALLQVTRWPVRARQALVPLVRAKAAAEGERDYLARYLAHPRLDAALSERHTTQRKR